MNDSDYIKPSERREEVGTDREPVDKPFEYPDPDIDVEDMTIEEVVCPHCGQLMEGNYP